MTVQSQSIDRKQRFRIPPQSAPERDPALRIGDWGEICPGFDVTAASIEASRCLQCPTRPCVHACPLHNDIPAALACLEAGDLDGAAAVYRQTSNFPEICSRLCPQERLCEGHCVRAKGGAPVQIGRLERLVADHSPRPCPPAAPPSGRRVAIVGAGPAGLAAAEELALRGHACTVLDGWPLPGGVLLYGIPSFKLPKSIVAARVTRLRRFGVRFVQDTVVGRDVTFAQLCADYDAVFLATGAGVGGRPGVPGEELAGVYSATEFLVRANVSPESLPAGMREPLDRRGAVVVIGGGDTAMDCLRSAIRLGVEQVTCVYRRTEAEMPVRTDERAHACEEGARFRFLAAPLAFLADADGRLSAVRFQEMVLGEADTSGRRAPVPLSGAEFELPCRTAVVALGYKADEIWKQAAPELALGATGLIAVDAETGRTSVANVFAAGDNVHGPDLVVTAVAGARRAARAIDAYLQGLPADDGATARRP